MKCKHCGEKFSLPVDNAPGIFLAVAVFFIAIGLVLWALEVRIWPFVLWGAGGFIALQAEVNRGDFNRGLSDGISRTKCPKCKETAIVKLWSI
jgi:uncharacterized protein (DUF983 family)